MARRLAAAAAAVAAVLLVAWLALRAPPVQVQTALADRGPLAETVEGTGKVRVRERFEVAAPVGGALLRIGTHAGDVVRAGEIVARVASPASPPLDPRTRAELEARLGAALAAEQEARAGRERARVAAQQADRALERARAVASGGALADASLEEAEALARGRAEERHMAEGALQRTGAEAAAIRATLGTGSGGGSTVAVRAPVGGTVLRVLHESGGPVAAGTPLLELGDLRRLELSVDLPSPDAVRVRAGQDALVTGWGGAGPLRAVVRQVEPGAFTKVTPLGVEEQRVYVLLDPAGPGWEALGDGYAADVAVVVREHRDPVRVPASALFRAEGADALFVVAGERARLTRVEVLGRAGGRTALGKGLEPGARVVIHPGDQLHDGARVAAE